jgi:hypothetical protein
MRTITVFCTVTRENITEGEPDSSTMCPIALALGALGYSYLVNGVALYAWREGKYGWVADLPAEAIRFIEDFDQESEVKPFTFEVTFNN